MHHNAVTLNSSIGDELFTSTPAGGGGVTITTGADNYKFNNNWVCGNLSTGDGGGVAHMGFIWNGDIENNMFVFNQSTNPTIPANGGGLIVMGGPPDGVTATGGPECGSVTDSDCVPGLSDGTGPGLVINANMFVGNAAESGSGGGIRFQAVNGTDVARFPNQSQYWYSVQVTNNIISNNVAGWDGAGVSLEDSLVVNFINNTVMSNDTTASSGVLFNTLGAPLASGQSPSPTCTTNCGTTSAPQPAGLVALLNSPQLISSFAGLTIVCPTTHPNCTQVSYPLLANDVFYQNRAFFIGVGSLGAGSLNQQNVVALYNAFSGTPAVTQPQADATTPNGGGLLVTGGTGACTPGASYWDLGVRGDTGPTNHPTFTLNPTYSVLTSTTGYATSNTAGNPDVLSEYCNGSRLPPENGGTGYQVPPGIADATVPNPVFALTPAATVDEGNNWINMSWGPLSLVNPVTLTTLGNYGPAAGSSVINFMPSTATANYAEAPSTDYYGNLRKNGAVDAGAIEFISGGATAIASVTPTSLNFGSVLVGTTSASQNLTLHNTGNAVLTGIGVVISGPFSRIATGAFPAGAPNCNAAGTLAAGANCTIKVVFTPTVVGPSTGSVAISANVPVSGSPVSLSGGGLVPVVGAKLAPPTWTTNAARGCGVLGCPVQVFTLTNTGNVTLTGITQATLVAQSPTADFSIVRALSTCGPGGGGQLLGQTTLAPGAACVVTVRFAPPASDNTAQRSATLSVTDAAGTQTSALTGTPR